MRKFLSFLLIACLITAQPVWALRCENVFFSPTKTTDNFHETLWVLNFLIGKDLTPDLTQQMNALDNMAISQSFTDYLNLKKLFSLRPYKTNDGRISLKFTNNKYKTLEGDQSIWWKDASTTDANNMSQSLLQMANLMALQQYKQLAPQSHVLSRALPFYKYSAKKQAQLKQIESELYLKSLLHAFDFYSTSSNIRFFLPHRLLKTQNVLLDEGTYTVLKNEGLAAFQARVAKIYGPRIAIRITNQTVSNMMLFSSLFSVLMLTYWLQQANEYFAEHADFETGISGEMHDSFEKLAKDSLLKSEKDVLQSIRGQNYSDPEIKSFLDDLSQEIK